MTWTDKAVLIEKIESFFMYERKDGMSRERRKLWGTNTGEERQIEIVKINVHVSNFCARTDNAYGVLLRRRG